MFSNNTANIGFCPETVAKWQKDSETTKTITYRRTYTAPDASTVQIEYITIRRDQAWIKVSADYVLNDQQKPFPPFSFGGANAKGPVVEIFHVGYPTPVLTLSADVVAVGDTTIDFTTVLSTETTARAAFQHEGSAEIAAFPALTAGNVTQTGTAINALKYSTATYHFTSTGFTTADSTIKLQESIDGTNWVDIAGTSNTIGSGAQNVIDSGPIQAKFIRVVYTRVTNAAGTFKVDVILK